MKLNSMWRIVVAAAVICVSGTTAFAAGRVFTNDVVIIGAGGAGLAAAVSAAQSGAKVTVLEKLPVIGGHTIISGGSVNAPDPERQAKAGIKDSPDLFYEQTLKAGDYRNDPAVVRVLADNATDMLTWFESLGLKWDDRVFEAWGGLYPRSHNSGAAAAGKDYIRVLNDSAKKLGVTVKTNTKVMDLLRDGSEGRVYGVKALNKSGDTDTYLAKAVIIASGGFTANIPMRMKYNPRLNEKFRTTANPQGKALDGSTGDGIIMAKKIGADDVGMDYIQLIPFSGGRVIDYVGGDIFVNFDGKRFVNEGGRRDAIADAILSQRGQKMWVITDDQSIKGASLKTKLEKGIVFKADTVEEMARKMEVDPKVLQQTLDRYNQYAKDKQDPDFGKAMFTQTVDKAPYYFGIETADVHFTCGGLRISPKAEVIDLDGKAIPGLFAAGEVAGGIHGTNRAGGNSLTAIFVFGRIAGTNAAQLK
ncbi:flavocytochrome c [Geobacter sp. FeAm09]|uniref:FAD-dependent oxidoreductase n=1 Tax=Geobacter sp. FeAm09 TaxID=2597769 RepID=UPI0011EDD6E8|nr:flavocytochrome c [Geobacter sp. FeAm09]QEM70043.1 flavocytochrome c [Geobacter sp. FeAm09]